MTNPGREDERVSRGGSRRTSARSSRACRTRDGSVAAAHEDAQVGHLARVPLERLARTASANVDDVQGVEVRSLREECLSSSPRRPPLLPLTKMRRGRVRRGSVKGVGHGFRGSVRARGGCGPRDASRRADATGRRPVRGRINSAPARGDRGDDASRARARRARAPEAAKDALVDVDVAWESIEIGARSGAAWRRASRSGRPPLTRRRSP